MVKKSPHLKVESSGDVMGKLTTVEKEIYGYLCKGLTPQQIIIKRGRKGIRSKESTYRPLRKLKKLGIVGHGYNLVENLGGGSPYSPHFKNKKLRLHGQQFTVQILDSDERYNKFLKTCNSRIIDNNTLMFYRDKIIVYGVTSFAGNSVSECMAKSTTYWNRFLRRLENDYNLILIKPRKSNIYFFNQHWAEVGNELAREYNDNCENLQVRTNDDGKVWLLIDNSFNLNELEATHPQSAPFDIQKMQKHFNSIRDNDILEPHKLQLLVEGLLKVNIEQKEKLAYVTDLIGNMAILQKNEMELNKAMRMDIQELKRK